MCPCFCQYTGPGGDSEHGVVDGDWRSKRMWGPLESRNDYICAQSLNVWNAYIKGLRLTSPGYPARPSARATARHVRVPPRHVRPVRRRGRPPARHVIV